MTKQDDAAPVDGVVMRPCPFCGGKLFDGAVRRFGTWDEWQVRCLRCEALGPTELSKIAARESWNNWRRSYDEMSLALKLSRCVHDLCHEVPHDIGLTLEEIVRKHVSDA